VDLAEESEVGRSHPSERPQQGHGDPGGGIRHPARRGGGDDREAARREELGRKREEGLWSAILDISFSSSPLTSYLNKYFITTYSMIVNHWIIKGGWRDG